MGIGYTVVRGRVLGNPEKVILPESFGISEVVELVFQVGLCYVVVLQRIKTLPDGSTLFLCFRQIQAIMDQNSSGTIVLRPQIVVIQDLQSAQ